MKDRYTRLGFGQLERDRTEPNRYADLKKQPAAPKGQEAERLRIQEQQRQRQRRRTLADFTGLIA
jgi:hypothetical protein